MVAPFVCEVMRKVVMLLQCWSLTALIGGAEEQVTQFYGLNAT